MLSVGDIMSQFREQFRQAVGKLQKSNKNVQTSALHFNICQLIRVCVILNNKTALSLSTVEKTLREVLNGKNKDNDAEETTEDERQVLHLRRLSSHRLSYLINNYQLNFRAVFSCFTPILFHQYMAYILVVLQYLRALDHIQNKLYTQTLSNSL